MSAFGQAPSPFGAPSTGFGFGAPAAAPSTNPFGASSTPAFGASSTPAFGTPAASSTPSLFGASSTPVFGAPTSTPAFGSNVFGSSTPAFGASSTPAFGAPTGGGLFGAASSAAASSGGAFSFNLPASASSAAAAGTTGFGSIFSSPAAPAAPGGGGLFGQQQQQPAAAASSAGSIFGALTVAGQQQQVSAGTQLSPLAYSSHEAVKRELEAVAAAYMPGHSSYRFQHIYLNVLENPVQRIKPHVVDELSWKQAMRDAGGPDNPDKLWPVPANGFDDLVKRGQAQVIGLAENRKRLSALREGAYKLAQRQAGLVAKVARAREQHMELSNRLLGVARHVDGLEGRLASYMGLRGELSRGKEAGLSRALVALEVQLSPTSPAGLQRRMDTLAAACRLRASSGGLGVGLAGQGGGKLDDASLGQLFGVLKEHVDGLKQLQEVLRRDMLDVEIMQGVRQDSIVPAAMNLAAVEYI